MDLSQLPLNALRAFEASARLNSFTRAGLELHISQTAVSHHIKALEDLIGVRLFKRMPRGVALTDEGDRLLPVLTDAFRRMSAVLSEFQEGNYREVLTVGVVSSFAVGWLLPRLEMFRSQFPTIDIRLKTNNNRADFLGDGLDSYIRFGDGSWHGAAAEPVLTPKFAPICSQKLSGKLGRPEDLGRVPLLRSYRRYEWNAWFQAAGCPAPRVTGHVFDSSNSLVEAAALGVGAALVPLDLFSRELESTRIVQPFPQTIKLGSYWITWLKSRRESPAMRAFRDWLVRSAEDRCV
ncbi:LysR family transcriptional regulator [Roseibium denhamense]|uniref:LysR family transcriptional regulator, regulator of gene expression of beta-lactamase n=1 Tax=Roseibium denhamense TaxID=76305 RepID=A0ABY1N793_9HYPH|nr:LysR family transcriptional regulator [Roseibium denhamense]MTI05990.1 LysR family transcriptional regulator [Roseibium denhamense]SMP02320.1 LysR family transcriptional regulator, regulator of gene expression of beta-lactamase [Roseibium denhamense]